MLPLLTLTHDAHRRAVPRAPEPAPRSPHWPLLAESLTVVGDPRALGTLAEALTRRARDHVGHLDEVHFSREKDRFHRMAFWRSPADLRAFVEAAHPDMLTHHTTVGVFPTVERTLWWVPAGTEITPEEALARAEHLRERGPGRHAFTLRSPVPAPALF